jgi:hypothetical protein
VDYPKPAIQILNTSINPKSSIRNFWAYLLTQTQHPP